MEYEREEVDVPEFGAIFMSNMATKRECFRRNILALPSSRAHFVKHVKEGMVLFLFEFEKRLLFGVYRATSDGGMNISPSPFVNSGKQFPAQVCFAPIWECNPLCESEFRNAIKENYYTAKKFRFGLSEKQVRQLLHLFSSRKISSGQFNRIVTRQAGNDRRWADECSFSIRERLEMGRCEDDLTPMDMSEYSQNSPRRAIEADDSMVFIDDTLENGKGINIIGDNLWTDQVGDSLHKRKRVYDNDADMGLYDTHTLPLSYRTENCEVSLDKDRIQATHGRFLMAEDSEKKYNAYGSLSPGVGTKYTKGPLDSTRRADFERPLFESTNRHATDIDRFLGNDFIKSKLNLPRSFGPFISDEIEEDRHGRPGRATDGSVLRMSRFGQNRNMDDDVNPVVPLKKSDNLPHMIEGTSGRSKHLMDKRMEADHNLDNGLGFELFPENLRNSFDSDSRAIDERGFFPGNKMMKSDCMVGVPISTTSYEPSGFDTRVQRRVAGDYPFSENSVSVNRQEGGNSLRPASYAAFSNSLDCFSKSSLDNQFLERKGLQNLKTSNSKYHDSVVTRTIPSTPECSAIKRRSFSTGIDQGASLALDAPPYYGCRGDFLDLSNRNSFEGEGSSRYDSAYDIENKDFHHASNDFTSPYAAHVSPCLELRSSAPTVDTTLLFDPSTHRSVPLTESRDMCSQRESPLASGNHSILPPGMQKHNHWAENDQRNAGNGELSSSTNWTGLGNHWERHLTNEELEYYKSYKTNTSKDDGEHFLNPGNVCLDSEMPRKSVFTRLKSGPRVRIQEENEKDDTSCLHASVDEVMEMLNSCQNIRLKNPRKFKPVVRQHDRNEIVRIENQASPEQVKRFLPTRVEDETSRVIEEDVHEMPKETREVEFKRRRDSKKWLYENSTQNDGLSTEDNTSRENVKFEGTVNKQPNRRKLVRPIFGSTTSVVAVGNEDLHSQSHSSQNQTQ